MKIKMEKANMLAENMNDFIKFVHKNYENKNSLNLNKDKVYQIKLFIEEFKYQILADELIRINQFTWDEKYTYLLVGRFKKGLTIIEEYIENNYKDLFIFSARIYTLKNLSSLFSKEE